MMVMIIDVRQMLAEAPKKEEVKTSQPQEKPSMSTRIKLVAAKTNVFYFDH
jgi:hypothetical protein